MLLTPEGGLPLPHLDDSVGHGWSVGSTGSDPVGKEAEELLLLVFCTLIVRLVIEGGRTRTMGPGPEGTTGGTSECASAVAI